MTLAEMSREYEASAALLRARLRQLRAELAKAEDPEEIWHLKRRMAELTAHYYERGYWRGEKYTL